MCITDLARLYQLVCYTILQTVIELVGGHFPPEKQRRQFALSSAFILILSPLASSMRAAMWRAAS